MMKTVSNKWNRIYSQAEYQESPAVPVLIENAYLLPGSGRALDLACGAGCNAIYLARHGLATEAWDISSVAIEKLQTYADTQALQIKAQVRSIDRHSFMEDSFDVIVISHFLDRSLAKAIIKALKPGGMLFYQTFTKEKTCQKGPNNPDYLLNANELLQLFSPLRVVFYRENGALGDLAVGLRNEAQYIGRKR